MIRAGAKINHQNEFGNTALFEAVNVGFVDEDGKLDPLRLLVATESVDLNIQNSEGKSALDKAKNMNRSEAAQIIQDAMK